MGYSITGVGCHSLLQGIFLTQGFNLGLLHYRWTLYHLSHQGSPLIPYFCLDSVSLSLFSPHFTPHSPAKSIVIWSSKSCVPWALPLVNQLVQEAGILCLTVYQERVSKPWLDCVKEFTSVFVENGQLAKVILADFISTLSNVCQSAFFSWFYSTSSNECQSA